MSMPDELLRARRSAGLTLRQLGDLAGTSAATLHTYEHGTKVPSWPTFERIIRATGRAPTIEVLPELGPTDFPVDDLVDGLRSLDDSGRIRLMMEFLDRWNETPPDRRPRVVAVDPGLLDDRRWDAFVGGFVEHLCWHAAMPAPDWVEDPARFLDGAWWPIDLPIFRALSIGHTPAALWRRGVMFSDENFLRA